MAGSYSNLTGSCCSVAASSARLPLGLLGMEGVCYSELAPGRKAELQRRRKGFAHHWQWLLKLPSTHAFLHTPTEDGIERGRALGCIYSPCLKEESQGGVWEKVSWFLVNRDETAHLASDT